MLRSGGLATKKKPNQKYNSYKVKLVFDTFFIDVLMQCYFVQIVTH